MIYYRNLLISFQNYLIYVYLYKAPLAQQEEALDLKSIQSGFEFQVGYYFNFKYFKIMVKINYSKELLQQVIAKSYSIADVCRELGLKPVGGNYRTIKKKCQEYDIDISHFTGQIWTKSPLKNNYLVDRLNNILSNKQEFKKSSSLKQKLIAASLKEDKCEICGCLNVWNNKPITLELHHINGNHDDNTLSNLQILCPNCHSQQPGHKKSKINSSGFQTAFKKHKEELKICICMQCAKEFKSDRLDRTRKFCSIKCYRDYVMQFGNKNIQNRNNVHKLILDEVKEVIKNCTTITEIADHFNCDRGTVRQFLKENNLYTDFKAKNKSK